MLKFKSLLVVLLSLAFVATACDKKQEAEADEPEAAEETQEAAAESEPEEKAEEKAAAEEAEADELAVAEVPKEGKKFDPVVEVAQIPEGAWYCDMGTVHYARMEEGDGSCAECGMKLKHKTGGDEAAGEKAAAVDDHAGHNHE